MCDAWKGYDYQRWYGNYMFHTMTKKGSTKKIVENWKCHKPYKKKIEKKQTLKFKNHLKFTVKIKKQPIAMVLWCAHNFQIAYCFSSSTML